MIDNAKADAALAALFASGDYTPEDAVAARPLIKLLLALQEYLLRQGRYQVMPGDGSTQGSNYVTVSHNLFPGSAFAGTPTKAQAITHGDLGVVGAIRIYDSTNGKVIAENPSIPVLAAPSIIDLGPMQNLPITQAIFEIQIKRVVGTGTSKFKVYCRTLEWV